MKIKSLHLAVITLVILFGGIGLTSLTGYWKTTNDKVPAVYKEGEFKGQYDPADIRGSYTFNDIYKSFEVPIEDLAKAFGIKDESRFASFQCKELEALYASLKAEGKEIGTGSVRYFVALYKGLPIKAEEGTYLPKPAVELLKVKAKLTLEQINSLEKYSVVLPEASAAGAAPASADSSAKTSAEKAVKGTTTFKEMLDWGVKKEDIEKVIMDKITDPNKVIKDYAAEKGIEFVSVKEPLQKLADALKK